MRKRAGSAALAAAAVLAVGAAVVPAHAEGDVQGTVIARAGLNVHSGSPTGSVVATMPYNSSVEISCYVTGPTETGPYGATRIWDAVDGYTTPSGQSYTFVGGTRVFATDAWIYTGTNDAVVPHC